MTLAMAWTRGVQDLRELVVASDSRLRFGRSWDCCPKVLTLPRSDCLLCFAGDTAYAYPLMLQLRTAIGVYPPTRDRQNELRDVRGHALRVVNGMLDALNDPPRGPAARPSPNAQMILAGYAWREREFMIWRLYYDERIGRYTYAPTRSWDGIEEGDRRLLILGDRQAEAHDRLIELLRERGKVDTGDFDMEPFEVLRDMIRENASPYIGGPPQLAKVYLHLNSREFGVFWPDRDSGEVALMGRQLLSYEDLSHQPVLDPDTLHVTSMREEGLEPSARSDD